MGNRLWVAYTTAKFEETITFYAEGLGLAEIGAWDRGENDRGKYFALAGGVIEIMAIPNANYDGHMDLRSPQGLTIGVEIEDIEAWYQRATDHGLPIRIELADFPEGERGFSVVDPNGVMLYIFSVQYNGVDGTND
jgi:uncharacterized glyoxalase superfamily protein PhnB